MINELLFIAVVLFAVSCGVAATLGRLMTRFGKVVAIVACGLAAPLAIVLIAGAMTIAAPAGLGRGEGSLILVGSTELAFLSLPVCLVASWLTFHWLRLRPARPTP